MIDTRRIIYFLGLCITTRFVIAYTVWKYPNLASRYGLLALIPVIGWIYIYFVSGRDTGPEVFGGKIWWNQLRIPHAMLWALAALYSQQSNTVNIAWIPIFTDTLFGLTSWIYNLIILNK